VEEVYPITYGAFKGFVVHMHNKDILIKRCRKMHGKVYGNRGTQKIKSQLVSHGIEQDTLLYPDRSSTTAAICTIMTALAVAACSRNYTQGKLDVKDMFIQTETKGTHVYIKCRGQLRDLILATYPEYSRFVGNNGILCCRLKNAIYGCIQASKLWYEKLKSFLFPTGGRVFK
jgi:hypothetical protein